MRAKAAELVGRRNGHDKAARTLAGVAAVLQTQGEALDQRIHATDSHYGSIASVLFPLRIELKSAFRKSSLEILN